MQLKKYAVASLILLFLDASKFVLTLAVVTIIYINISSGCFGQRPGTSTITKETVGVNLGGRVFEKSLPFDEKFTLNGAIPTDVKKIVLYYKAETSTDATKYFRHVPTVSRTIPGIGTISYEGKRVWERLGDEEKFMLGEIGPLRPNTIYKFQFETFRKILITDPLKVKLQESIFRTLNMHLANSANIVSGTFVSLNKDLNSEIDLVLKQFDMSLSKLRDLDGNPIAISAFSNGPMQDISTEIIRQSAIVDLNSDPTPAYQSVTVNDLKLVEIEKCINSKTVYTPNTKEILEMPLDESIAEIGKTKVVNAIAILKPLVQNANLLKRLFDGGLKITPAGLAPSEAIDLNSLKFLTSVLTIIQTSSLSYSQTIKGTQVIQPIFQNSQVVTWLNGLNQLQIAQQKVVAAKKMIETLSSRVPTYFLDQYLLNIYEIFDSAEIDVESEKTPYISLDAGLVGTPNTLKTNGQILGTNMYFFTYQGANIYFLPVNKRAKLADFKWPYSFLKGFSVHLGTAQFLSAQKNSRVENSFGDLGNLLIGCGYRFNRVTKVGVSMVFLKVQDINPIVDRSRLLPYFSLTFSADLNVAKAFGDVGKALKLFQ